MIDATQVPLDPLNAMFNGMMHRIFVLCVVLRTWQEYIQLDVVWVPNHRARSLMEPTRMTMSSSSSSSSSTNEGFFQRTTTSTSSNTTTQVLDTIGLKNWTMVDVYKSIVLMLYNGGIARGLIVFQNIDRVSAPLAVLGYCGLSW